MTDRRERGICENTDRRYLRGEKEYPNIDGEGKHNAEYKRQEAIRQRLKDGIIDFKIVQPNLSGWNWQKFLDSDREEEQDLRRGMVCAMGLFYEIHQAKGWDFETSLRDAVEQAHMAGGSKRDMPRHTVKGVNFKAKTNRPEQNQEIHRRIEEKLENEEPLTHYERSVALAIGGVLKDKVSEHIDKMIKKELNEDANERMRERFDRHGIPEIDDE